LETTIWTEALFQIKTTDDAALFVKACQKLRFWERKSQVQVKEQVQNAHAM